MRFRWTMKDLEEKTDLEILRGIVAERKTDCTNVYSPLSKKLQEIYHKLDQKIKKGQKVV